MAEDKTNNDLWHLLGAIDAKLDRVVKDTGLQDKRITKLEHHRWFQAGIAACVSTVCAAIGVIFFKG